MKGYKLSKYVEKVFETSSSEYSEWFGYYNYDTLTSDHSKLLCNRIKEDGVNHVLISKLRLATMISLLVSGIMWVSLILGTGNRVVWLNGLMMMR